MGKDRHPADNQEISRIPAGMLRYVTLAVLPLVVHAAVLAAPVADALSAGPTSTLWQGQSLMLSLGVAAVNTPPSSGSVIQNATFIGGGASFSSGTGLWSSDAVNVGAPTDTLRSGWFPYYVPGQFTAGASGALYQSQLNLVPYGYSEWVSSGYWYSARCGLFSYCSYWADTSHWESRTGYTTSAQGDSTSFYRELTVNVLNIAPNIGSVSVPGAVTQGNAFEFSATAWDPGIYDVLSYSWDFDDDGAFDDFVGRSGSFTPTALATNGALRVCDTWGACALQRFGLLVAAAPVEPAIVREGSVPIPATVALIGLGIAGLGWRRGKRRS